MSVLQSTPIATYQNDILAALSATGITQLAVGGKARALADIVGDKLGRLDQQTFLNLSQTLLPYASGAALDALGDIYGTPRLAAQDAEVTSSDGNITFYVRSGSFGQVNGGAAITIPSNSMVTSADASVIYLVDSVTLQASSSSQSVSARAASAGDSGNAGPGTLVRHNVTNYVDSAFGSLLVTNNFGVIGGRSTETDDNYRYRIQLQLRGRAGANEAALRLAILQIPGVQNVVFERMPGFVNVFLYTVAPTLSSGLQALAQAAVNDIIAFPNQALVIQPNLVGISLATSITFSSTATTNDQNAAISAAQISVQAYVNNLAIGQTLSLQRAADQIRSASGLILSLGTTSRELDQVYIWRSRLDGTRYSRFLISNYTPQLGERLVIENLASPVILTAS